MSYHDPTQMFSSPSTPPALSPSHARSHARTQDLIVAFTDRVATVFETRGRTSITYLEFCRVYRELVLQPDLDLAFSPQLRGDSQGAPNLPTAVNFEMPSKLNPDGNQTQSPLQGGGTRGGEAKEGPPQTLPTIRSEAVLPPL